MSEIRCDNETCTATLWAAGTTNEAESLTLAHAAGWSAWMGAQRAYHRCAACSGPGPGEPPRLEDARTAQPVHAGEWLSGRPPFDDEEVTQ